MKFKNQNMCALSIRLKFFLTILCTISFNAEAVLSIRMEPPNDFKRASGNQAWNIFLSGKIEARDSERVLKEFSKLGKNAVADVYFNSPGGNLVAALEIGQIIRHAGFNTHVGRKMPDANEIAPGHCHSSCALAFLGGRYRFFSANSTYGVHLAHLPTGKSDDDLSLGQILSAGIARYIREMGVAPALLDLIVEADPDEIYILSAQEASDLNVVNNGRDRAEWTIEANNGIQYLRGVQNTMYGMGKAVFHCSHGHVTFFSVYEAGKRISAVISRGNWSHSIMFNESQVISLGKPKKIEASDVYINSAFDMPQELVQVLYAADSVGHAMQQANDAPTFIGYRVDIDKEGSRRIQGFIDACRKLTPSRVQ